jgi:hypothetical protein
MNRSSVRALRRLPQTTLTSRAIRLALHSSALGLMLATGGHAFAACVPAGVPAPGTTVQCDGVFPGTITYNVDDLTVVIGGNNPGTTVTPGYSQDGVVLNGGATGGSVINYGGITTAGIATAIVVSAAGNVSAENHGILYGYGYYAVYGMHGTSTAGDVDMDNQGSIAAIGYYPGQYSFVLGIRADASNGDITIDNSGDVYVFSDYSADGIAAWDQVGDVSLNNSGEIDAVAYQYAIGMFSNAYGGDIVASNSGDILAAAYYGATWGIVVGAFGPGGSVQVDNSGSIYNAGAPQGWGILANADGVATVDNSGSIESHAYGSAFGIAANSYSGDTFVDNSGDISTLSFVGTAIGIQATANNGLVTITNSGDISAFSYDGAARGIRVQSSGDIDISLTDTSSIYAVSEFNSYGVFARSVFGVYANVDNAGSIDASGYNATGILARAAYADASSSGSIEVDSGHDAIAIWARGTYGASGVNTGQIVANTVTSGTVNNPYAGGLFVTASNGDAYGANSGSIQVSVIGTGFLDANAEGMVVSGYVDAAVFNTGTIDVYMNAVGGYGSDAMGIALAAQSSAYGYNGGDITVHSELGQASGIYLRGSGVIDFVNEGSMSITAGPGSSVDYGSYGVFARYVGGDVTVTNASSGSIDTAASGGNYAYADGIHLVLYYSDGIVVQNGDISASASGDFAVQARGIYVLADNIDISTGAGSTTTATGTGDAYAFVVGIKAIGTYGVSISNSGDATATAIGGGEAYGIYTYMVGAGDISIYNDGYVGATAAGGTAHAIHAYTLAGSSAVIHNSGTMTGAIATGPGDDLLLNLPTGVWNATGDSYFGAGDDAIYNDGTINMDDATIDLGIDPAGNVFENTGLITVSGINTIHMGTLADFVTPNIYAFVNNGTIDMQDGSASDRLNVYGDFDGIGDVNLDVSPLTGASDVLYIDGDVASASVSTLNVHVLDTPGSSSLDVPMVLVGGVSSPGNFVLGDVTYPNYFLSLDFDLVNGSIAGQDAYLLRTTAADLSDLGKLGATIAPGVNLIMRDTVGTLEQRDADAAGAAGSGPLSLWARVYRNQGWVSPRASSSFGPDGGLDFDLRTGGGETGLNYRSSGKFNFGLILGRSELKQNLREGDGSDAIKGNVYGGYGTMKLPGGFFLDLSHRKLKFDAVLDANGIELQSGGVADTSNLEAGYTFMSKKKLGVQLQFQQMITRITSIDTLAGPVPLENDGGRSSLTRIAGEVRKTWEPTPKGTVWVGRVILNALRESSGESEYSMGTDTGKASISGNSFRLEAGASATRGMFMAHGSLVYENGGALHNFVGVQLGGRLVW